MARDLYGRKVHNRHRPRFHRIRQIARVNRHECLEQGLLPQVIFRGQNDQAIGMKALFRNPVIRESLRSDMIARITPVKPKRVRKKKVDSVK